MSIEWGKPVPFDHPIELECDHGHHTVIDPESLQRLMNQKRFRCFDCGRRRLPIRLMQAATVNDRGEMVGICNLCNAGYDD